MAKNCGVYIHASTRTNDDKMTKGAQITRDNSMLKFDLIKTNQMFVLPRQKHIVRSLDKHDGSHLPNYTPQQIAKLTYKYLLYMHSLTKLEEAKTLKS